MKYRKMILVLLLNYETAHFNIVAISEKTFRTSREKCLKRYFIISPYIGAHFLRLTSTIEFSIIIFGSFSELMRSVSVKQNNSAPHNERKVFFIFHFIEEMPCRAMIYTFNVAFIWNYNYSS